MFIQKRIIFPEPFHGKAFILLYKIWKELNIAWRTEQRFFLFFFASQEPPTFAFHEPAPDFIGSLTAVRATSSSLLFCSCAPLKLLIFSWSIQDFRFSPSFPIFKTFISRWPFTTQLYDFSSFYTAISRTGKPLDWSMQCSCSQLDERFCVKRGGFIFHDIHKKN